MKLCSSVRLTQDEWGAFLLEKDRLASLLIGLGGDGVGREVWAGYLDALTPALVSPDLSGADPETARAVHDWERIVHRHLRIAAERLTARGVKLAPALPEGGVARLFAANNLVKWISNPATAERDGSDEIRHACDLYGVDRLDVVRVAYLTGEFDHLELPAQLPHLEPILALFRTTFPVDDQYHTARTAVTQWLQLSAVCPRQARGYFQAHYVITCVPDAHYSNLLSDRQQFSSITFEPLAEATIRQRLSSPSRRAGPKYPPPPPAAPEGEKEADESNRSRSGKKKVGFESSRSQYSSPRRRAGSNSWMWIAVALAVVIVLVVAAILLLKNRGRENRATEARPGQTPVEKRTTTRDKQQATSN
jgi:hypothetical protein